MVIGVLAMQGAYKEHINILQDLDVSPVVKALPWENLLEPLIFMMI